MIKPTMRIQLRSGILFFLSTLLLMIMIAPVIEANPLSFKDNKGTIIKQGQDYIVRLLDTPGSKIKTAEALFLVKASPDAVYRIITDYNHYPEFMPNIAKTTILQKSGTATRCKFTLKIALFEIEYTLSLKSDINSRPYSLAWDFIEGDINDTTGAWLIEKDGEEGNYSLVHYTVHTDPGRLVPDWIANKLSSESIPDMIAAIRTRAEKSTNK